MGVSISLADACVLTYSHVISNRYTIIDLYDHTQIVWPTYHNCRLITAFNRAKSRSYHELRLVVNIKYVISSVEINLLKSCILLLTHFCKVLFSNKSCSTAKKNLTWQVCLLPHEGLRGVIKNDMNPNQFMHQNQILDDLGRSSETIHINIVNILIRAWSRKTF